MWQSTACKLGYPSGKPAQLGPVCAAAALGTGRPNYEGGTPPPFSHPTSGEDYSSRGRGPATAGCPRAAATTTSTGSNTTYAATAAGAGVCGPVPAPSLAPAPVSRRGPASDGEVGFASPTSSPHRLKQLGKQQRRRLAEHERR